jgi:alpha-tubulin suppressor-like RCC1 family protein
MNRSRRSTWVLVALTVVVGAGLLAGCRLTDSSAVDAGGTHTCAVSTTGTVKCWGLNDAGQLGNASVAQAESPMAVAGVSDVVEVALGARHTCARLGDGTATCWGANESGQLGDGTTDDSSSPVVVSGLTDVVELAANANQTCARLGDGTARCWGDNASGQLGNGTTDDATAPVAVSNLTNVASITLGTGHGCAVLQNGAGRCWGLNADGQLGDRTFNNSLVPVNVPRPVPFAEIAAGESHTCASHTDGTVTCWGANGQGQGGRSNLNDTNRATAVTGLTGVTQIVVGDRHTCALLSDATANCWGDDNESQLGDGTGSSGVSSDWVPDPVLGLVGATQLTAGATHTCALLSNADTDCWGANAAGQLGNGSIGDASWPVGVGQSVDLLAVEEVSGGSTHSCALLATGEVRCWGGINGFPRLGNGTEGASAFPVTVPLSGPAVDIDSATEHTCATLADGTVQCWGGSGTGWALGHGSTQEALTPVTAVGVTGAVSVATTSNSTCALIGDGTVWCWGTAGVGTGRWPAAIPGIDGLIHLVVGSNHQCGIEADASITCWGSNLQGQLGDGTNVAGIKTVSGINDAVALAAGNSYACAVRSDGTTWCWGANDDGQLGDGTTDESWAPVQVVGVSNAIGALSANEQSFTPHTCVGLADGTARCWGDNDDGQLGDGTTTPALTPVVVGSIGDVVDLGMGSDHTCAVRSSGRAACWGDSHWLQLGNGGFPSTLPTTVKSPPA